MAEINDIKELREVLENLPEVLRNNVIKNSLTKEYDEAIQDFKNATNCTEWLSENGTEEVVTSLIVYFT